MNNTLLPPLLITSGEPAGVGPELCALLTETNLASQLNRPIVILGDTHLLTQRANSAGIQKNWHTIKTLNNTPHEPSFFLHHQSLHAPCITGKPDSANAAYVLELLNTACDACLSNSAAAMVTAPIQKSTISAHWPGFMGHTEYLAKRCGQSNVVMMLVGGSMKVALATTHIPLAQVSSMITQELLTQTLQIILKDLTKYWGIDKPKILVTGLNPHAGEAGELGMEEINVISPIIHSFQTQGHHVQGPYPADTLFQPKYLQHCDAVLTMFHDQGLPVLKHASFGQGVNITLGLPIVRTSVDHGTALTLAGTRHINLGSLLEAIECAHRMDLCRRKTQ
jgi:4-hydroxythreonine-4-phosphate dehydrogenase